MYGVAGCGRPGVSRWSDSRASCLGGFESVITRVLNTSFHFAIGSPILRDSGPQILGCAVTGLIIFSSSIRRYSAFSLWDLFGITSRQNWRYAPVISMVLVLNVPWNMSGVASRIFDGSKIRRWKELIASISCLRFSFDMPLSVRSVRRCSSRRDASSREGQGFLKSKSAVLATFARVSRLRDSSSANHQTEPECGDFTRGIWVRCSGHCSVPRNRATNFLCLWRHCSMTVPRKMSKCYRREYVNCDEAVEDEAGGPPGWPLFLSQKSRLIMSKLDSQSYPSSII